MTEPTDREFARSQRLGLPAHQTGWNHPAFDPFRHKLEEENSFIENPIADIAEGIIQCSKCKSSKTFSYQKQVRSSDEGFTLFVNCVNCNANWVEN
jgi:DNA-directed RNA polymerase subunit M/transcription elongation factor TFIIS